MSFRLAAFSAELTADLVLEKDTAFGWVTWGALEVTSDSAQTSLTSVTSN